jgi:hypothetical protein
VVLRVGNRDTKEVSRCAGIVVVDDDQLGSNDSECLPYRDTLVTPFFMERIGRDCRMAECFIILYVLCGTLW